MKGKRSKAHSEGKVCNFISHKIPIWKNEGNPLKVDSLSVNDFKYYYIISVYFIWRWAVISKHLVNTLK